MHGNRVTQKLKDLNGSFNNSTTKFYAMLKRVSLYNLSNLSQTRQPPIQSEKYQSRIDTVNSPDDEHIDARNM